MKNRIKYIEHDEGFEVHIVSGKSRLFLFILSAIFLVWTVFGIYIFVPFISGKCFDGEIMTVILPIVWTYAELETGLALFWNAFGKEIIEISDGILTITRDLFGLRLKKSFQVNEVLHLRTVGFYGSIHFGFLGLTGGSIAFDFIGKTHRIGIQLEENDALEVVKKLNPFFPNPESHIR